MSEPTDSAEPHVGAVAIVGMALRVPDAADLKTFWQNLLDGRESIRDLAADELEDDFDAATRAGASYVRRRPVLDGIENFDATYFGMAPREAALTDPQQRVFLECAVAALEDAAIVPAHATGPIGVFAGSAMNTYFLRHVVPNRDALRAFTNQFQVGQYPELLGAMQDFLASRVAYKLDLKGPAVTVQSACSTSLLAVAQACQSLQLYQCDAALAGGVSISVPQQRGYESLEGGMVSADGHVRPFDSQANGTVFGSGCGVVVLKRLEDAQAAGDHIYAIIRGAGVNNDGADKVGFTAPSVAGQADAIRLAHANAGVAAGDISYVEAHGTATPLGDPIEFRALADVFADAATGSCTLGSVKANVGHLDAAAGVTGLIKAALALHHETLPPQINFSAANAAIALARSPFKIVTASTPWPRGAQRRKAGVSAFGVGGTNVHLVLEEAPALKRAASPLDTAVVLAVSAKSPAALARNANLLARALERAEAPSLADASETLIAGRPVHVHRLAVTARTHAAAIAALDSAAKSTPASIIADAKLVFMFPGQGAQYPGMTARLYATDPTVRQWIDRGAQVAQPLLGLDIRKSLFDSVPADETTPHALRDTTLAQPALYIVEHALAQALIARGAKPDAMIGHSLGEFVAAALAGVFSFEDGLRLVAARGRAMQELPGGAMLAVRGLRAEVERLIGAGVEIAAINAPQLITVAGPYQAITAFETRAAASGLVTRRLHTSHAFHSAMMEPAAAKLAALCRTMPLSAPCIPFVSSVTGTWITATEATSPDYWARHARAPVMFADALATVVANAQSLLLEVGPGRTLATFARQSATGISPEHIVTTLPEFGDRADDAESFMSAQARLWRLGRNIQLPRVTGARRVPLPGYAFEPTRHWMELTDVPLAATPMPAVLQQPFSIPDTMTNHTSAITRDVVQILEELTGAPIEGDAIDRTFLELGFDSLLLGQVAQRIQKSMGVKIGFRQLLADLPTVAQLVAHLAPLVPKKVQATATVAPIAAVTASNTNMTAPQGTGALDALIREQLASVERIIAQQLQALGGAQTSASAPALSTPKQSATPVVSADDAIGGERFRMFEQKPRAASGAARLTAAQQNLINSLISRSDVKFKSSKADTQAHRRTQADPRSASGFRAEWKELVYPLVVTRSHGSQLIDADTNSFVDLVNGFGQTMFGHAPAFVTDALKAQLDLGFAIGPQTPLAGALATELADHLGHQRVAFCNTGSEAVMAAMRIARAVTGRSKIAFFGGDYHGQFDEVLAKGLSKRSAQPGAQPAAAGIPRESVSNMVVLAYDAPESLAWIRANADDLAAVLVEPVQSRHPALFPQAFLRNLRTLTKETGVALIFDEVVTGFRVHPQGVQGLLGITADIATYGKVLGGGMPLGILAGDAKFLDALDGGAWQFGDASVPEVAPTFFAGTFVRHPLTLAAAQATLAHMRDAGPALQTLLSATTRGLVDRLNASFAQRSIKTRAEVFASFFFFNLAAEDPLAGLLYPLMRLEGVHIAESFPCFLTTAHTDADIAKIIAAFDTALDALQAAGILAPAGKIATPHIAAITPNTAIPAVTLPDAVTPTPAQREIYLAAQLDDRASCAFNEQVALTFEGDIKAEHLTSALNDLVARHDALRGQFGVTGEQMIVARSLVLDMPIHDLSRTTDAKRALDEAMAESARTPFDLAGGPLLRATLYQLGATTHALALTVHHIVCDGWSINTIVAELAALYAARVNGTTAELTPALPFRQFAAGEAAAETTGNRAFWTALYRDAPEPLELPSDRPRPTERSWAGATVTDTIDAATLQAFKQTAAKQGATLFSALFASLQLVLGRLAGSDDVVLTVPMAAQTKLEGQSLVGHAVNFLPLRARFDATQPFTRHLASVNAAMREAFAHQDYTLGSLVADLNLKRSVNRTPLSDVQFNLERLPEPIDIPGGRITVAPAPKTAVNFDLFVNMIESRDGLRIDVDHNTDMYDAATIRRWISHLRAAMHAIAAAPETAMADVELLGPYDRAALLADFSATARAYPRDKTIHALFEAQARRTPAVRAVTCDGVSLTYGELDAAANRLAHLISQTAEGPRSRIAVVVDRATDMLVALLAAMKSGHAYVPLDPTHPPARLAATLAAADVAAVVVSGSTRPAWVPAGVPVVALDASRDVLERMPVNPVHGVAPGDSATSAYVIFTSGSTGTPKGVEVGHGAVVNFLTAMAETPGFTARDHLLAVTTVCFDIAGLELFLPLLTGGSLTIATRDDVQDGFALVEMIKTSGATVLQATPSLWRMLLEAGFMPNANIKMLCGGEPLPRDLADQLSSHGAELWNMYGPTETTIWSAAAHVDAGAITIGSAIANTQLVVLDGNDRLALPGAVGELNIGGDGLARGYFGRPDLTAAAFRTLTLAPGQTRRFYRTGDLARRFADGRIVLLGRRDQQIKLRGYRIELEDIETALRAAGGVAAAAVAVRDDGQAGPQLAAFIVPVPGTQLNQNELQAHVAARLPAYMVPAVWTSTAALPMTGNGKLDRKALAALPVAPEPPASSGTQPHAHSTRALAQPSRPTLVAKPAAAPVSPTASKIAAVWQDVLGLQTVAHTTPILDLGADSLHLFRIAARLHALQVPLQARDLLKQPTIELQARLADERLGDRQDAVTAKPAAKLTAAPSLADYRAGHKRNTPAAS
jgi:amino acid adenylation domain-containing protein